MARPTVRVCQVELKRGKYVPSNNAVELLGLLQQGTYYVVYGVCAVKIAFRR